MNLPHVPNPRQGHSGTGHLQQLDILRMPNLELCPVPGQRIEIPTPHGVVIVSQTCDIVRSEPPLLAVSPLVQKTDDAPTLRKGSRPSFVHVPGMGDDWFVDLNQVGMVSKVIAALLPMQRGALSGEELSRASRLIGRKFSRFAFPDDVVPWLKPLESIVDSKHHKAASAEGRMFQRVDELRVETSRSWSQSPHSLTLCVVLKRDVLPIFSDESLPFKPSGFDDVLRPGGRLRAADEIAGRLEKSTDAVEIYWLWEALAESWAARCKPKESDLRRLGDEEREHVLGALQDGEIAYDLSTVDDFSMYRYKNSEMLDLEYLSPADSPFEVSLKSGDPSIN